MKAAHLIYTIALCWSCSSGRGRVRHMLLNAEGL